MVAYTSTPKTVTSSTRLPNLFTRGAYRRLRRRYTVHPTSTTTHASTTPAMTYGDRTQNVPCCRLPGGGARHSTRTDCARLEVCWPNAWITGGGYLAHARTCVY